MKSVHIYHHFGQIQHVFSKITTNHHYGTAMEVELSKFTYMYDHILKIKHFDNMKCPV